jgi:putative transposase
MLPSRESHRLKGYDYAQPGMYFVTICAANRQNLFGHIVAGAMHPSPIGFLAGDVWREFPQHCNNVSLDVWVLMPNHFHALLLINKPDPKAPGRALKSLGAGVGSFKAAVSKRAGELNLITGPVWHDRFHDHIVRHEKALERIREYIVNNPKQWELDRENLEGSGSNEFYAWLEAYVKKTASPV